ncbi:hypothetical protein BESB_006760 [Besnoitia besnoiti]|uniref:PIPK domain-containing protein n=1 Tax=Besnoitia besnoiti TaxID=94643 RepID=A0A2A9MK39_BESBE|nr:hypothetical protein BESB_006760 [Besnoitia besnoiti]PFH38335.1 hypothetical protein BESB_006760 [Besnoitia besnoiti]
MKRNGVQVGAGHSPNEEEGEAEERGEDVRRASAGGASDASAPARPSQGLRQTSLTSKPRGGSLRGDSDYASAGGLSGGRSEPPSEAAPGPRSAREGNAPQPTRRRGFVALVTSGGRPKLWCLPRGLRGAGKRPGATPPDTRTPHFDGQQKRTNSPRQRRRGGRLAPAAIVSKKTRALPQCLRINRLSCMADPAGTDATRSHGEDVGDVLKFLQGTGSEPQFLLMYPPHRTLLWSLSDPLVLLAFYHYLEEIRIARILAVTGYRSADACVIDARGMGFVSGDLLLMLDVLHTFFYSRKYIPKARVREFTRRLVEPCLLVLQPAGLVSPALLPASLTKPRRGAESEELNTHLFLSTYQLYLNNYSTNTRSVGAPGCGAESPGGDTQRLGPAARSAFAVESEFTERSAAFAEDVKLEAQQQTAVGGKAPLATHVSDDAEGGEEKAAAPPKPSHLSLFPSRSTLGNSISLSHVEECAHWAAHINLLLTRSDGPEKEAARTTFLKTCMNLIMKQLLDPWKEFVERSLPQFLHGIFDPDFSVQTAIMDKLYRLRRDLEAATGIPCSTPMGPQAEAPSQPHTRFPERAKGEPASRLSPFRVETPSEEGGEAARASPPRPSERGRRKKRAADSSPSGGEDAGGRGNSLERTSKKGRKPEKNRSSLRPDEVGARSPSVARGADESDPERDDASSEVSRGASPSARGRRKEEGMPKGGRRSTVAKPRRRAEHRQTLNAVASLFPDADDEKGRGREPGGRAGRESHLSSAGAPGTLPRLRTPPVVSAASSCPSAPSRQTLLGGHGGGGDTRAAAVSGSGSRRRGKERHRRGSGFRDEVDSCASSSSRASERGYSSGQSSASCASSSPESSSASCSSPSSASASSATSLQAATRHSQRRVSRTAKHKDSGSRASEQLPHMGSCLARLSPVGPAAEALEDFALTNLSDRASPSRAHVGLRLVKMNALRQAGIPGLLRGRREEGRAPAVGGNAVREDSPFYALTFAMMLGLQMSNELSACILRLRHENGSSLDLEFLLEEPLLLPVRQFHFWCYPQLPRQFFCVFDDFAPDTFECARELAGVTEQDYRSSMCRTDFSFIEFESNSKSGQFFLFSHDGKYLIKTISLREVKQVLKILPAYTDHLLSNPNSLLTRLFGLHRVEIYKRYDLLDEDEFCHRGSRGTDDQAGDLFSAAEDASASPAASPSNLSHDLCARILRASSNATILEGDEEAEAEDEEACERASSPGAPRPDAPARGRSDRQRPPDSPRSARRDSEETPGGGDAPGNEAAPEALAGGVSAPGGGGDNDGSGDNDDVETASPPDIRFASRETQHSAFPPAGSSQASWPGQGAASPAGEGCVPPRTRPSGQRPGDGVAQPPGFTHADKERGLLFRGSLKGMRDTVRASLRPVASDDVPAAAAAESAFTLPRSVRLPSRPLKREQTPSASGESHIQHIASLVAGKLSQRQDGLGKKKEGRDSAKGAEKKKPADTQRSGLGGRPHVKLVGSKSKAPAQKTLRHSDSRTFAVRDDAKKHSVTCAYFVVIGTAFDPFLGLHEAYDLKGSTVSRRAKPDDRVKKDVDWLQLHRRLGLRDEEAQELLRAHRLDCELLETLGVFDYSLLVGIHKCKRGMPAQTESRRGSLDGAPGSKAPEESGGVDGPLRQYTRSCHESKQFTDRSLSAESGAWREPSPADNVPLISTSPSTASLEEVKSRAISPALEGAPGAGDAEAAPGNSGDDSPRDRREESQRARNEELSRDRGGASRGRAEDGSAAAVDARAAAGAERDESKDEKGEAGEEAPFDPDEKSGLAKAFTAAAKKPVGKAHFSAVARMRSPPLCSSDSSLGRETSREDLSLVLATPTLQTTPTHAAACEDSREGKGRSGDCLVADLRSHPARSRGGENILSASSSKLPYSHTVCSFYTKSCMETAFMSPPSPDSGFGVKVMSADMSEIYFLGIIDFLTPYDWRRYGHTAYKRLKSTIMCEFGEISPVPPAYYAHRQHTFVRKHVIKALQRDSMERRPRAVLAAERTGMSRRKLIKVMRTRARERMEERQEDSEDNAEAEVEEDGIPKEGKALRKRLARETRKLNKDSLRKKGAGPNLRSGSKWSLTLFEGRKGKSDEGEGNKTNKSERTHHRKQKK